MNSTLTAPPSTRYKAAQATTMRAIVQDKYGSPEVLNLREVDMPELLDDEVLVRIHAAAVNTADWIALTGRPYAARAAFGLFRPKRRIPGIAIAGRVARVGGNVTQFKPGDEVFGEVHSAYAEYVCVAADRIRYETNQPDVRASGGGAAGRHHRLARSARQRQGPAGAPGPHQWRIGRRRVVRRSDCQSAGSGSDGCM